MYCEEIDIEAVPPLPKETAYLYARFNKIKRIAVSDFADISKYCSNLNFCLSDSIFEVVVP